MRNFKKFLLATLAAVSVNFLSGAVTSAEELPAEEKIPVPEISKVEDNKIHFDVSEFGKIEMPDYLVKGVAGEVAKNILPLSVEARFYAPHFNIKVQSDDIHYNGGTVGLKDDLGFGNDNAPEFILRYKRLSLDFIHVSGNGTRTFDASEFLTFQNVDYTGEVKSKNRFTYLKLNVTNPIFSVAGSGVDWSYGLTGIFWKGSVRGTDSLGNYTSESESYGLPVPTVGIGAHADLIPTMPSTLRAYTHLSGLPLGGYGHFYDFELGLIYNPIENLAVNVGFRRIHANVHHDDDSGTLTLNGPFAGLRYEF